MSAFTFDFLVPSDRGGRARTSGSLVTSVALHALILMCFLLIHPAAESVAKSGISMTASGGEPLGFSHPVANCSSCALKGGLPGRRKRRRELTITFDCCQYPCVKSSLGERKSLSPAFESFYFGSQNTSKASRSSSVIDPKTASSFATSPA